MSGFAPKLGYAFAFVFAWSLGQPLFAEEVELTPPSALFSEKTDVFNIPLAGLPLVQERIDGEFQETLKWGSFRARAAPWAWTWVPNTVGAENRNARGFFEMKEGWAEYATPSWELRLGNQLISWGTTDQINPTDAWNPRDYQDPFTGQKLPVTAARLKIHPESIDFLSLDLIATPFFRASRLPLAIPDQGTADFSRTDSRWLLPLPSSLVASGGFSAPIQYKVTEANYPETWEFGARLQLLRFGGWDFSISGYDGVEPIPRFAVTEQGSTTDPSLPVTVTLHPSYHRQRIYGLDGAGSVSVNGHDFGTRFEFAYYDPDNSRAYQVPQYEADLLRDPVIFAVAGVDYTFPSKIFDTVLYVNAQYVHYQKLGSLQQATSSFVIEGLPNTTPFDDNALLYLEDRIGNSFKVTGALVESFAQGDVYVNPALRYDWSDHFKTVLSADVFAGNPNGFFGQLYQSTRVSLSASLQL